MRFPEPIDPLTSPRTTVDRPLRASDTIELTVCEYDKSYCYSCKYSFPLVIFGSLTFAFPLLLILILLSFGKFVAFTYYCMLAGKL